MDTDTLGRDKIQANVGISFWLMPLICFKGGESVWEEELQPPESLLRALEQVLRS